MKNILGTPVRREDFLDRTAEVERLWWLVARSSILMLAPRRVGKTSLLYHLYDQPRDGWHCLFCTVESASTESEFVARLLSKVLELEPRGVAWARLGQALRKLLSGLEQVNAGFVTVDVKRLIGQGWKDVGEIILRAMAQLEGKSLILIDEFPIFVGNLLHQPEGDDRSRLFMNWFRKIRNDLNLRYGSVRFILTGSVGLDAVVKQTGMTSTINDLEPFSLQPLSRDLADELLKRLANGEGIPLNDGLRSGILDRITWLIPFHVQLIFRQLAQKVLFHHRELTPSLLDEAYQDLLSSEKRTHFEHWVERLNHPLIIPEERDLMKAILEAAALDPEGISKDTVRLLRADRASGVSEDAILLSLERDGYLIQRGNRWSFASSLLRDWWLKWILNKKD